jgi:hypothetical protein
LNLFQIYMNFGSLIEFQKIFKPLRKRKGLTGAGPKLAHGSRLRPAGHKAMVGYADRTMTMDAAQPTCAGARLTQSQRPAAACR